MKIGDSIYVHGYVDEIRKDTIIIRNAGGYFGTIKSEIVEPESIRHGKWIDRNGAKVAPFWERYECSLCGERSYNSNFCPNCGADMRGKKR